MLLVCWLSVIYPIFKPSYIVILTERKIVLLVGSILAYVFYWLAVVVTLVYLKFKEVSFTSPAEHSCWARFLDIFGINHLLPRAALKYLEGSQRRVFAVGKRGLRPRDRGWVRK